MKNTTRRLSQILVLITVLAATVLGTPGAASADSSYGHPSVSYSGVSNPPTSDKPQSKLWWNDGSWWADMWTTGSGWHIYRLDRSTGIWVDTGVLNDTRSSTLADTLWDGSNLYIASHVVTVSSDETPVASSPGNPARLYRYSYSGGTYTLDAGFPATITDNSSESMTIAEDSTGALWATWTQVSGSSSAGFTSTVYVNQSSPGGTSWGAPFVIPASDPNPSPDDISGIVAFGANKIGVMWSDHAAGTMYWATRTDGTDPKAASSWRDQPAIKGPGQSDDHLNLKTLQADTSGRVFASVKTSLNDTSSNPALPQLLLLVFKPGTGSFSQTTIASTGDCVSRPQILLDTENNLIHAFHTAPSTSVSGCAYSGVAGSIYRKTASLDNPVFESGRGTPVIQDGSSPNMNNVTTTKQSVNSATGLVVMASDNVSKRYWYSDEAITSTTPPPPAGGEVTAGNSTTSYSATASNTVALTAPAEITAGDVLVASITADLNPSMASIPVGWIPVVNALSINSSSSSGARVFAYYRVVGTAEPASYSWTLSAAVKWGAGVTAYQGVNNATPLDSPVATAVNATYSATSITVPSITTLSNGAMLIGGVGFDNGTPAASPPSGWTERWEALGGQIAELADRPQAIAGATGTATWSFSSARAVGAWRAALKPAS